MSVQEANEVIYSQDVITENYLVPPTSLTAIDDPFLTDLIPAKYGSPQNVVVLSLLLALALITNLSAFPVILFRRTR